MEKKQPPAPSKENETTVKENESSSKKKHPVRVFFVTIICIILFVLLAVVLWCLYASVDRKESLSVVPAQFAAYIRTDHLWASANPLVDVKALDVFLSDAKYGTVRNAVMQFRASPLRNNKWLALAADRRTDAAFYSDGSFVAAVDMGILSAATRLAPLFYRQIQVKGLSYVTSESNSWFQYESGKTVIFAKPYHNLLLIASSKKLFDKMCTASCRADYSAERLEELSQRLNAPFRVACDVNTLLAFDETISYKIAPKVQPLLKTDTLAFVDFGVTNEDMHLKLSFPLASLTKNDVSAFAEDAKLPEPLVSLVCNASTESQLLKNLPASVQYYTLLNAAEIPLLVSAVTPFIPADKDVDGLWAKGESLCKMFFSLSLEDLFYSWTGKEIAVLGLEGKKDPVFAIQIADEDKRAAVFKQLTASILLDERSSLVLNGMRIPQLSLPEFLQNILNVMNVRIAKPYYYVSNGFVYFSESAENIVQIASSAGEDALVSTDNFKAVSSLQYDATSVSLYYNLARSIPFFLKAKTSFSAALQLYNIGRADVSVNRNRKGEGTLEVLLQAVSHEEKSTTAVPGYPLTLDGKKNMQFCRNVEKKPQLVFWVQDDTNIQLLCVDTSTGANYSCSAKVQIVPAEKNAAAGVLWAVTGDGSVFLFDKEMKPLSGFPVALGAGASVSPVCYKDMLLVYVDDGTFRFVKTDGTFTTKTIGENVKLQSPPAVLGNVIAFYSKRLAGTLVMTAGGVEDPSAAVFTAPVASIAYGSPALLLKDEHASIEMAFVTQSGSFSLYNGEANALLSAPVALEKVYYTNAVSDGTYFYVLSSDAILTRFDANGEMFSVQIPDLTAQSATLTTFDYDGDGKKELFVNGDSNLIYGFTNSLELLKKFPVAGRGAPVFADLDGDNKNECLTISLDNKLNAYKVLKK
jgi:hypothetical protein